MNLDFHADNLILVAILVAIVSYTIHAGDSRERRLLRILDCYSTQLTRIANELSVLSHRQDRMEGALMGRGPSYDNSSIEISGSSVSMRDAVGGDLRKQDEYNK